MMKKTILVVEDFKTVLEYICEMLENIGYETIGATNGNDAFNIVANSDKPINLIITDYYMPDCTGFELLKRIKSNPDFSKIPVIFLTTESNSELIRNAKDAGLTAWIKKPYRSGPFFAQIESAITLSDSKP